MRIWSNKTHRGFNRLCVALAAVGAFAFIGFNALTGKYRVYKAGERFTVGGTYEQTIKERVRNQWREWFVNDEHKNRSVSGEYSTKARILKDVQSMKEAKYFSKDKLEKLIDKTIEREGISRLGEDISQKDVESERAICEGYAWQFHRHFRPRTWCVLSRRLDWTRFRLICGW